jgi:hypothetical protein
MPPKKYSKHVSMTPEIEDLLLDALRAGDISLHKWYAEDRDNRPTPKTVFLHRAKDKEFQEKYELAQKDGYVNYADSVLKKIEDFDPKDFSEKCCYKVIQKLKKVPVFKELPEETKQIILKTLTDNAIDNKYIAAEQHNLDLLWKASCWYLGRRYKEKFGDKIDITNTVTVVESTPEEDEKKIKEYNEKLALEAKERVH